MPVNRKLSEETKRKIKEANSGKNHWNYGRHWSAETLEKLRISHLAPPEGETKRCTKCNCVLPIELFGKSYDGSGRHRAECKQCKEAYLQDYKHRTGRTRPLSDAKDTTVYLGVHIAERILSRYFEDVKRMPYGNPGYDFLCKRGYKIDVKSSTLIHTDGRPEYWKFMIKKNQVADYFLCLAFDNRERLTPLHIWLIPGDIVRDHHGLHISNLENRIMKWSRFERPIDKVADCCEVLRGESNEESVQCRS